MLGFKIKPYGALTIPFVASLFYGSASFVFAADFENAIVESLPQWHEMPLQFPFEETVGPETYLVKTSTDHEGRGQIRSLVRVKRLETRPAMIQVEIETDLFADVSGVPFRVYLEIVNPEHGSVLWKIERQLTSSKNTTVTRRPLVRFTLSSDESEKILQGGASVSFIQHPVEWWGSRERAPGPLNLQTHRTHVLVLPGLLGAGYDIRRMEDTISGSRDSSGELMSIQTWDWTRFWKQPETLQDKILIVKQTQEIGEKFALQVAEWRRRNSKAQDIDVVAMSAGTMIAAMACEAKDANGNYILPENIFNKIVFMSGALSMFYDFSHLDRCSKDIYNYYSDKDDILTIAFPRVFLFFELPVSVSWPAIGRFGINRDVPNFAHITAQLPYIRRSYGGDADDLRNSGRHLNPGCLADPYFEKYFLPLFTGATLPDLWQKGTHPLYDQDQRHQSAPVGQPIF